MQRYLVGVDGSASAQSALRWAAQLAAVVGAEIIAVYAYESLWADPPPNGHDPLEEDCRDLLTDLWTRPARSTGAAVRPVLLEGDPRLVLLDGARSEQVDLIVVGRGQPGHEPGFLHLSSVAEYCAHHADRPLAVIPADAPGPTSRFAVGAGGLPESLAAVEWTNQLAESAHASVLALDTEADDLLDAAHNSGADVVVVGMRSTAGPADVRSGGAALVALHRATLPIILVPPPIDPAGEG